MDVKYKLPMVAATVLLAASLSLAFGSTSAAKPQPATANAKAQKSTHHATHHSSKKTRRARGQKAIDGERIRQIQEALVREHYLKGEPSGKWDASTQQALHRYQADQGWQSKSIPDSRALIRLGLGPDHEHLLNPDSAMTMAAEPTAHVASRSSVSAKASSSHVSLPAGGSIPANSAQVSAPSSGISAVPAR
ncbi:MAG: Peptidoglycan-binding domain 1 [Acidobacteriaceae bacterium]|nr:Peptidoglycan-binding domain 1 [Acidobacteriaceae bacterium]